MSFLTEISDKLYLGNSVRYTYRDDSSEHVEKGAGGWQAAASLAWKQNTTSLRARLILLNLAPIGRRTTKNRSDHFDLDHELLFASEAFVRARPSMHKAVDLDTP
uniref:Uncharacterized protein n=1 Tax=Grammatophora oceanica TaxID=210454 RepID=A0A7S1UTE5_9STRA|mmetsp:Transcript_21627/g.32198  ORF Transcript_21627/g.32198 Transcript_21627/m.32198 type:complete len:105 (+) Transcript_21627:362-676(+)